MKQDERNKTDELIMVLDAILEKINACKSEKELKEFPKSCSHLLQYERQATPSIGITCFSLKANGIFSGGANDIILSCAILKPNSGGLYEIVSKLDENGIEFTISVPFERFSELKMMIDCRRRWRYFNGELSYFDTSWKPKKWDDKFRFLFIRKKVKQQSKELVQLDLFVPLQYGFEFKVIVTNKLTTMKKVLYFHNGRGSQENTIGELKSQCNMDYVAVRRLHGNHLYLMAAVMTHNILKELHMLVHARQRGTTEKRAALWEFTEPNTLRRSLLQRAGRITHPAGTLTLTLSANPIVKKGILHYIERLKQAA